jgi:hypothetical protein
MGDMSWTRKVVFVNKMSNMLIFQVLSMASTIKRQKLIKKANL